MVKDHARVYGLSSFRHTVKTRGIFNSLRIENKIKNEDEDDFNKSDFIRKSIMHLAQKNGFKDKPSEQPNYISTNKWNEIEELKRKSTVIRNGKTMRSRGNRGVDYTYLYAFEFLSKTILEFKHVGVAEIQRQAIVCYYEAIVAKRFANHTRGLIL